MFKPKTMKRLLIVILASLFFILPQRANAWGQLGHRIVGEIASSYLSSKARSAIKKILGTESVAMASTWADFVKSDSAYKYLDTWHYVNYGKGLSYEQFQEVSRKDTGVNAFTKLHFLIDELKKKDQTLENKQIYLKLLIHLVGDIHQPLHVSPEGSSGGNSIKVQWFSTPSNLHRVWDSDLIELQQLSYTEHAAHINHVTATQKMVLMAAPITAWFFESYTIAQQLHEEIKETNPRLGYNYNYNHISTLNQQLLKGGVRLAAVLNDIYR